MLVYNTNTTVNKGLLGTGYYFWNGTQWKKIIRDFDAFLIDADGDTKVHVEESPDEDTIRLDAEGIEVATFTATQTHLNTAITATVQPCGSAETLPLPETLR